MIDMEVELAIWIPVGHFQDREMKRMFQLLQVWTTEVIHL
jgi:hypothetical protein